MNLNQLMRADVPDIRYVVPGLLSPGCALMAAKPKVGKSGFVQQLAVCVASGVGFLDYEPSPPMPVFQIAFEDELSTLRKRARLQMLRLGVRPSSNLEITTEFPKAENGGFERLEEIIEDWFSGETGLLIVDDLRHFKPLVRSYNRDNDTIERIDRIGIEAGICIVVVNHQGKGRTSNNRNWDWLDRIQGSGTGAARQIMALEREVAEPNGLFRATGKGIAEVCKEVDYDGESGFWSVRAEAPELTEKQNALLDAIRTAPGMKARQIADRVGGDFEAVRQMLRRMGKAGNLRVDDRRYYVSEPVQPATTAATQIDLGEIVPVDGHTVAVHGFAATDGYHGVPLTALDGRQAKWLADRDSRVAG